MLRETAELVRFRLETIRFAGEANPLSILAYFPRGCCKVASLVYLYYLREYRKVEPQLLYLVANAQITEGYSHAWARVGTFHIDLTGDQFGKEKIVISYGSPWLDVYDEPNEYPLATAVGKDYERKLAKVCQYINQNDL